MPHDYPTINPRPEALRLARRLPAVHRVAEEALAAVVAGELEDCQLGDLDTATAAWICPSDEQRLVRCWLHGLRHAEAHGQQLLDCLECGGTGTGRVQVDDAVYQWIRDPDRPELMLAVSCLVVCHDCNRSRR